MYLLFCQVYDYCMNIPELTEVGLAMSHASVLLPSVCSFRSHSTRLHQSPPLFLYQNARDKRGCGFQSKALLPLYETLNELGVFQSSMLQVNS